MTLRALRQIYSTGLLLTILAFLATGCGDSENFVFTGNNAAPAATTGNLTFNFEQAPAAQDIVPNGTTSLRFDFFSTNPPAQSSFVFTENRTFNTVVVIEDVPSNCVSVLVTAFNSDGLPLATYSGAFVVQPGQNVAVDLNDAVPVTLDAITVSPDPMNLAYGSDIPFFIGSPTDEIIELIGGDVQAVITGSFSNGSTAQLPITAATTTFSGLNNIANVTATGLFSVESLNAIGNNTTATATYTLGSSIQPDDFTINTSAMVAAPGTLIVSGGIDTEDPIITSPGGYDGGFAAGIIASNGISTFVDESDLTFALESPVTGISIDANTGVITAASGITANTSVFVLVTFVDTVRNLTYTSRIEMRVNPPVM